MSAVRAAVASKGEGMSAEKAYFNWSGGKDSALALHRALSSGAYRIEMLFSTVNEKGMRIAMHEVGIDLIARQAEALGLPLEILAFDSEGDPAEYRRAMGEKAEDFKRRGIRTALFGDISNEAVRAGRDEKLALAGMRGAFPLWGASSEDVAREFIDCGFKAIVTCVDAAVLDESFVGRQLDRSFFEDLPSSVDRCGEGGEYHSFAYDGPPFRHPVPFRIEGKVLVEYPACEGFPSRKCWHALLA